MDSWKWLTVFALAAFVASTAARPGPDVEPSKANEISSNEKDVQQEQKTITATGDKTEATLTADLTLESVVVEASTENVQANSQHNKEEIREEHKSDVFVAKPVNEQFPHAVLFGGTCGGTIISPNWVISAGHCTLFSGGRYVLAGTNNSDADNGVMRRVKRLVIHPRFSVGPYWLDADRFDIKQVAANWDFLLAELEEPLPLDGKTMAAVELDDGPSIPEGLEVGYAGYGAAHHGDVMRSEMHGMELQVLSDRVCQEALEQFEPQDMVCTQGRPPRQDSACNGDSGSGLVANGKLYGVASWVQDDAHRCFNGALVVFSRVSAVRDWIRQVTKV